MGMKPNGKSPITSEDLRRRYFHQLISAVGYCHSRGVFHQDHNVGPNTSHGHKALPHHSRPLGVPTMMTYNTPMSLLSLTEDVTRTFVPGEQLRVNIERDRRLEEGTAAQVLVGCRIISPKSLFPPEKLVEKLEQHRSCEEERNM
ncbi:hypothetical protein YC2023_039837 [Brassica napus]